MPLAGHVLAILVLLAMTTAAPSASAAAPSTGSAMSPAAALKTIMEGNQRFVAGQLVHPNRGDLRRIHVARGQNPIVAVLSCSDSRVPPEIIFDQGLGDIFVVRVAGNSVDALGLQSLAYSVEHLGATLILVLGHDSCGAVGAAVASYPKPDVGVMLSNLYPAVRAVEGQPGDAVSNAIDMNVKLMVTHLESAPMFAQRIKDHELMIVGGRYHLETGKVTIFPQ